MDVHEWGVHVGVDILAFGTGVKDGLAFISRPCLLCAVGHFFITTLGTTPLHLDNRGGRFACFHTPQTQTCSFMVQIWVCYSARGSH